MRSVSSWRCSFNNCVRCQSVRRRAGSSRLLAAPFPLPSEFQVNGSAREEAATPHSRARVHRPPPPPFLLPLDEAAGLPGELARTPRSRAGCNRWGWPARGPAPGLALVRMPGALAAGVGRKRGRRSGARRRAESPARSRAARWRPCGVRCARSVAPVVVSDRAAASRWVGRGAWGARSRGGTAAPRFRRGRGGQFR